MPRTNVTRVGSIVGFMMLTIASAMTVAATPMRAPQPRPPTTLPEPSFEKEEPKLLDDDDDRADDSCIMACRSAALLPVIVDYAASCEKSALGQELFQLVRAHGEGYMDFAEDLGSWCFWLVLDIFIEDGLDSQIVAAFERIRSRSY
jgi:hypothetical protein